MKQQCFAITRNKTLVKVTNNNCGWDEFYWKKHKGTDLFSSHFQSLHVGKTQNKTHTKEKEKRNKHTFKNNNGDLNFPLSIVHILDNMPVLGAKEFLAM